LLTWNCRNIANAELHGAMRHVVGRHGFDLPSLCTPERTDGRRAMKAIQWKDEIYS